MQRSRILVMTSTFPRWENDSEPAFVFELSRRLGCAFDITVLAPRAPGSKRQETIAGLRIIRFPYFIQSLEKLAMHGGGILNKLKTNPFYYLMVPFFLFGQLWALVRLLRRENFDLIHAHWLIPQGLVAVWAIILSGKKIPLVCTSHGGDLFALRGTPLQYVKRWIMQRSQLLTVVSRAMKNMIVDMGISPGKVHVISMGVDLKNLFVPDGTTARNPLELLFVGRLVEKKGVRVLLAALPAVLARNPRIHLTIAGSGPMETQLRELVKNLKLTDRVEFIGMVSQAELPNLYQTAALAIFPFIVARSGDQEGFGLVQVEAMGCECPVIVGDLPAIHDIITHGESGWICPSGDTQALSEMIIDALDHPELCEKMVKEGRRKVVERFDWDVIADKYGVIYKTINELEY